MAFLATVAFGSLIEHEGAAMNPTDGIDVIDIISAILAVLGSFFMFTAAWRIAHAGYLHPPAL